MFDLTAFTDLADHMEWADAAVWRTVLGSAAALDDADLRNRLCHFHLTQSAFLQIWTTGKFEFPDRSAFADTMSVFRWMRPYYGQLRSFLSSVDPSALDRPVVLPWAAKVDERLGRGPGPTTLWETIFQVFSHTTYHRGQANMRLRQLGTEPPLADYIAWIWLGRPPAEWPAG